MTDVPAPRGLAEGIHRLVPDFWIVQGLLEPATRLRAQVRPGRLDLAARCVKPARRVLDRHELQAGCLAIDFNPAKAGQHESVTSV